MVRRVKASGESRRSEARSRHPESEGALALLLGRLADEAGGGVVFVAGGEARAERATRLLWALRPEIETLLLPPWDCLPFERVSPSRRTSGLRVAALAALAEPAARPRIVVTTPEALVQRLPPAESIGGATLRVQVGEAIDPEALGAGLVRAGYLRDDRVDETGEFALRGQVVDVFPAGYFWPVRIGHEAGRVRSIASYDPATQRTTDEFETLALRPVSEWIAPDGTGERPAGAEHRLAARYDRLVDLHDLMPDALFVLAPGANERGDAFLEQIAEGDAARRRGRAPRGGGLYLDAAERDARLGRHPTHQLVEAGEDATSLPAFVLAPDPADALRRFVAHEARAKRRLVVVGPDAADRREVARRLVRAGAGEAEPARTWQEATTGRPDSVAMLDLALDRGFVDADGSVAVVATRDVLGSRARSAGPAAHVFEASQDEFRLDEPVIHLNHGVGCLKGIETVAAGREAADMIQLDYAGGSRLLVPAAEIHLMWRYGAGSDTLRLDRLDGETWTKRRAKVEREVDAAARALAEATQARRDAACPPLRPPLAEYERFVARFPYSETPDQASAVAAILDDLAGGRPSDRLVCGDVGFGKTEVALRAAAAVALAGRQVAIVAPTTVLVRQHLATFRRRFADLGIAIGHLSRLVPPAEARAVKAGLADGSVRIVIGTHALAGRDVAIPDLGLVVIDEEQRFGAKDKEAVRALGRDAHVLTLTATPIPRTLQSALVGLQAISVLATPPVDRSPVRTVVAPFDDDTVREALTREKRRGGQSFVVCPRIEDIAPLRERLARLVPNLSVAVAHGKLAAAAIDDVMVAFADGEGDVLLATNIIESGLDVPRANTMIVWHPERFGLGQLHQLRGRVGRGRVRGSAYLLHDPADAPPDATLRRLRTLETLARLGAGFAISEEDLDQRGAGDLIGDTQAGHVRLIGAGLYRRLLERALLAARGLPVPDEWVPDLRLGIGGAIPADYVPEAETRINLHARIARIRTRAEEADLAAELADRFGAPPEPVANLLDLARLRRLARDIGATRVDAGPKGIAFTFATPSERAPVLAAYAAGSAGAAVKDGRLVVARGCAEEGRIAAVEAVLRDLRRADREIVRDREPELA